MLIIPQLPSAFNFPSLPAKEGHCYTKSLLYGRKVNHCKKYSPIQSVLPCPALARVPESQDPELCGEAPANMARSSSRSAMSMLSTSSLISRKPGMRTRVNIAWCRRIERSLCFGQILSFRGATYRRNQGRHQGQGILSVAPPDRS